MLATWSAVGFGVSWLSAEHGRLRCTFLAVGHGEAIVLELPSGQTVLYDAGRSSAPGSVARSVSGYLWSRGITHAPAGHGKAF